MGQQQSNSYHSNQTARAYTTNKNEQFYNKLIQHEGLLKLREVPFKDCVQIEGQKGPLFVENIQITLKDLLQSRFYTNKLFPKQDVQRLIENVAYTLAYLQEHRIPYKDVSPQNIFYDEGVFKLLPNQLIPHSRYKKFYLSSCGTTTFKKIKEGNEQNLLQSKQSKQFVSLPPQMIIALRCKQQQINDIQILDKSNVFCLGLLILQVTTLLPSFECYDPQTCDILDQVITERIQMVRQYYSEEIAAIVANMLDYDYVQRMNLKQVSIFINRQLKKQLTSEAKNKGQIKKRDYLDQNTEHPTINNQNQTEANNESRMTKSQFTNKSRIQNEDQTQSRISKPCSNLSTQQKKRQKTNKIYMNGSIKQEQPEQIFSRQDRNKVYLRNSRDLEANKDTIQEKTHIKRRSNNILRQISNISNSVTEKNAKINEKFKPSIPQYSVRGQKKCVINQQQEQEQYQTSEFSKSRASTIKNSNDYLGYRAKTLKTPKQNTSHQQRWRFQTDSQIQNSNNTKNKGIRNQRYYKDFPQSNMEYKEENSFGCIKRDERGAKLVQRQAFGSKTDSIPEDTGSRGYFVNEKVSAYEKQHLNDFKEEDHSLNRIKSQIQRSRKLIEEFKRGQKSLY